MKLKTKNKLKKLNEVHIKKLNKIKKEWDYYYNNLCKNGLAVNNGWESELEELKKWVKMKTR